MRVRQRFTPAAFLLLGFLIPASPAFASCQVDFFGDLRCSAYNEADFRDAVAQGAFSVTLQAPVALSAPVAINQFVSVVLNGFTLTGPLVGSGRVSFFIQPSGIAILTGATHPTVTSFGPGIVMVGGTLDRPAFLGTTTLRATSPLMVTGGMEVGEPDHGMPSQFDQIIDTNGFDVTVAGDIDGWGARIIKTGGGALILNGKNTAQWGVTVREGILQVSSDSSLGVVPGDYGAGYPPAVALTIDGGALRASNSFVIARPLVLGSRGGTVDSNGFSVTVGAVSGPGDLVKSGAGTLVLAGPGRYAGATLVNGGTLRIAAADALPDGTALSIAEHAFVDAADQRIAVGSLEGRGALTIERGAVTVGRNNVSTTFDGVISGAGSMTKTGFGTLTFTRGQAYTGLTDVASGRLNMTGLAGPVVVREGGVLGGVGTIGGSVTVNGTLAPGLAGSAPSGALTSALTIEGDLLFTPQSTLAVSLDRSPVAMNVNGHATINGPTLSLTDGASSAPRVRVLPLMMSRGGTTGDFGTIIAPAFIDALVKSNGMTTYVVAERTDVPLASLAATENGRAAGTVVDVLRPAATGDLRQVLREVGALSDTGVSVALAQLGGSPATLAMRAGMLDGQDALRSVNDRIVDVRAAASESARTLGGPAGGGTGSGLWFKATGAHRSTNSAGASNLVGGLAGIDRPVGSGRWLVGGFGGFDRASLDAEPAASDVADRRYRGGAYVGATFDRAYVAGAVAGSLHRYSTSRRIAFAAQLEPSFGAGALLGGIDRTSTAQYSGREVTGFVESGLTGFGRRVTLQPLLGVDLSRIDCEDFTESGAGAIALTASRATATSVRTSAGVRALLHSMRDGAMNPHVEGRYIRELADASGELRAAFAAAPAQPFTIRGERPGKNALAASAGMSVIARGRAALSIDYRGLFAASDQRHTVTIGVAF